MQSFVEVQAPTEIAEPLGARARVLLPWGLALVAFAVLYASVAASLAQDWWTEPDAGHALLLLPLAGWLVARRRPMALEPAIGGSMVLLLPALLLKWVAVVGVDFYSARLSMLLALFGLVVAAWGWGQLRRWWLPAALVALSIPLPTFVLGAIAPPLQLVASRLGASLLRSRHVPVLLTGNVLHLPGHDLFVTEACSGLRSITALLSLGVLLAGTTLRRAPLRALLLAATLPIAVLVNAARVFLTGFLVYAVSPAFGEGFLHFTEGWLLFVLALAWLGALAWVAMRVERRLDARWQLEEPPRRVRYTRTVHA